MQHNRQRQEEKKKADKEKYFRELDESREIIENTCPEQWKKILNHLKRQCRLKKKGLSCPDAELARLYYHKREMTQVYSELGGFYEDIEE